MHLHLPRRAGRSKRLLHLLNRVSTVRMVRWWVWQVCGDDVGPGRARVRRQAGIAPAQRWVGLCRPSAGARGGAHRLERRRARCHVDAPNKTPTHVPEEGNVDPGSRLSRGTSLELTPAGEAELGKMRRLLKRQIMACAPTAAIARSRARQLGGMLCTHAAHTHRCTRSRARRAHRRRRPSRAARCSSRRRYRALSCRRFATSTFSARDAVTTCQQRARRKH